MAFEENILSLTEIPLKGVCIIKEVQLDKEEKLRLYDLGFLPKEVVVPMYCSFLNSIKAYRVRDTLIALRNDFSDKIKVVSETEVAENE